MEDGRYIATEGKYLWQYIFLFINLTFFCLGPGFKGNSPTSSFNRKLNCLKIHIKTIKKKRMWNSKLVYCIDEKIPWTNTCSFTTEVSVLLKYEVLQILAPWGSFVGSRKLLNCWVTTNYKLNCSWPHRVTSIWESSQNTQRCGKSRFGWESLMGPPVKNTIYLL